MRTIASSRRYTSGVLAGLSLVAVVSAIAPLPVAVSAAASAATVTTVPAAKPAPLMPTYNSPNATRVATTHVVTAPATTKYPWATDQTNGLDPYGMTMRQCVSYVAWYLNAHGTPFGYYTKGPKGVATFGNASTWSAAAVKAGFTVSAKPLVGTVAQWNSSEKITWTTKTGWSALQADSVGHVAIVTRVYPNGNVDLAQYNMNDARGFSTMTNVRAPRYIYVPLTSLRVP